MIRKSDSKGRTPVPQSTDDAGTVKLLNVRDLKTHFFTDEGVVKAVDGVSFSMEKGTTLGVVGESGCGKSVMSLSLIRLIDFPGRIAGGDIMFKGRNIRQLSDSEIRRIRGNEISVIFQEPMTSLNPVLTVGYQLSEVLYTHQNMNKRQAHDTVISMLRKVGISEPDKRFNQYVHSMSGGMRQRAMIAMALLCRPDLLIADEPTTALDVTIQAQILELMKQLQKDFDASIIFITHDLGVISEVADSVIVMYGGRIVESADVVTLFKNPLHPYTWGLMQCLPKLNEDTDQLYTIKGLVPHPMELSEGCKFNSRCRFVIPKCREEEPPLMHTGGGHYSACWRWDENLLEKQ
jgi:peptide/nickel transport system ATP-binding protein